MAVAKRARPAPKKPKKISRKAVLAKARPKKSSRTKVSRRPVKAAAVVRHAPAAKAVTHELVRHPANPILRPSWETYWEAKAVFNPAAAFEGGKVHLLYRAIGGDDVSTLGYASSRDGFVFDERSQEPVYVVPQHAARKQRTGPSPVSYCSGGGWNGGCEDPRLTFIDGDAYLLYTAFDGWGSVRIGLTSIKRNDFLNKRWKWRPQVLLSPPGEFHKNWVLFPRKINGRFAILHSLSPQVLIEYVDSLKNIKEGTIQSVAGPRDWSKRRSWDRRIRGIGPPPIETEKGWLVLYHANGKEDAHLYKLGAMLLDLKDPTKILTRSSEPILVPDECYENQGIKPGIVYCCGALVKDGQLNVYYGGADTVICVASTDLNKFLNKLVNSGTPKIKAAVKRPAYALRKKASK